MEKHWDDADEWSEMAEQVEDQNPAGGDKSLRVEFYVKAKKDEKASEEFGAPRFKECEYIRVIPPGDRSNLIDQPLDDVYRRRFAARYKRWKANRSDEFLDGFPLREWHQVTAAHIEELAYFNIRTVEQLAGVPDSHVPKLGAEYRKLVEKAKVFIETRESSAATDKLKADLDAAKNLAETQAQAIKTLQDQLTELREEFHGDKRKGMK